MSTLNDASLGALLARSGRLTPQRSVAIIAQIAAAVEASTDHAPITPATIVVAADDVAYLIPALSTQNVPADPATDVYALTSVLFESLTGFPAFADSSRAGTEVPRPSQLSPSVPATLDDVILRGLAPKPADRYRSPGELATAARLALPTAAPYQQQPAPHAPPVIVAGHQYGPQYPNPPQYPAPRPAVPPAVPQPTVPPPTAQSSGRATAIVTAILAFLGALVFGLEAAASWSFLRPANLSLADPWYFLATGYTAGSLMLLLGGILLLRHAPAGRWLIVTGCVLALMVPVFVMVPTEGPAALLDLPFAFSAILALLPPTKRWTARD